MIAVSTIMCAALRSFRGKLIAENVAKPVRLRWRFGISVLASHALGSHGFTLVWGVFRQGGAPRVLSIFCAGPFYEPRQPLSSVQGRSGSCTFLKRPISYGIHRTAGSD